MTKGSRRSQADRKKVSRSGRSVVKKSQRQQTPGNNDHFQPGFASPGNLSRANSGGSPEVQSALAEYEMHLALLEQEDENALADCATATTTMTTSNTFTSTSMAGDFEYTTANQDGGRGGGGVGGAGGGGGTCSAYGVSSPSSSSDVYSPYWSGVGSQDDTTPISDGYVSLDYSMPPIPPSSYATANGHEYHQRAPTGSQK